MKIIYMLIAFSNFINQNSCNSKDKVNLNKEEDFLQDKEINMLDYKVINTRKIKTQYDEIAETMQNQYKNIHQRQ